jgi:hypothetical protein
MVTDGRDVADVTKPSGQRSHSACRIRHGDKEDDMNANPLLAPVFASFTVELAKNVAIWLGEVFGGWTTDKGA